MIVNRLLKIFQICVLSLIISGCSVYSNKFSCNSALGANCKSAEEIHAMLQNGKIWELNNSTEKKCRGRKCIFLPEEDRIASSNNMIKIWIADTHKIQEHRDGNYWYLPSRE